jgi:mRNA interferase RelE/StbE
VTYTVTLSPAAALQLRKFDPHTRRRIQAALDLLADNPRPPAAQLLVGGAGEWRVRTTRRRVTTVGTTVEDGHVQVRLRATSV